MLEREATIVLFLDGGQYGFLSGDITNLVSDCQELKPTEIPMVPRLYIFELHNKFFIDNNKLIILL